MYVLLSVPYGVFFFWPAITAVRRGLPNLKRVVLINVFIPFFGPMVAESMRRETTPEPEAHTQLLSDEQPYTPPSEVAPLLVRQRTWRWGAIGALLGAAALFGLCLQGTGGGEGAVVCAFAYYPGGVVGFSIGEHSLHGWSAFSGRGRPEVRLTEAARKWPERRSRC